MLTTLVKKLGNIFIIITIIIPLGLYNHKVILRNNIKMDFKTSKI